MRILLTADPFVPVPPTLYGGIERIVATLVKRLRQSGHTVGLVAHPQSTATVDFFKSWPVVDPANVRGHLRNALALRQAVQEFRPDLVHSFSRIAYLTFLPRKSLPKIMSFQRAVSSYTVKLGAVLACGSLAFTGCSEHIAGLGRSHAGVWHAIPNFVDTDFYGYATTVSSDAPLVFLSRVESIKGAAMAIEVARRAGRRLLIAGNHAETGEEGAYWRERIEPELGKNGIDYVGPVNDVGKEALLKSAAAMIVPIQWDEPFGIVFAEALACGTPVISCPRGALPEIVRQGIDGFLINTVEEACTAVRDLAQINRRVCRERAESTFSARVVTARYEQLYRSMLAAA